VGCAVFDALHLFDWAEKILLIDAMQAGRPPGTVYRVDSLKDMDTGTTPASLHEFSVIQALEMIQKDPMPAVTIIGIEPEIIDFGLELSDAVEASLPLVWETDGKSSRTGSGFIKPRTRENLPLNITLWAWFQPRLTIPSTWNNYEHPVKENQYEKIQNNHTLA
jgi:hypothetical protein